MVMHACMRFRSLSFKASQLRSERTTASKLEISDLASISIFFGKKYCSSCQLYYPEEAVKNMSTESLVNSPKRIESLWYDMLYVICDMLAFPRVFVQKFSVAFQTIKTCLSFVLFVYLMLSFLDSS